MILWLDELLLILPTCSSTRTDPVGIDPFLLWAWRHSLCDGIVVCLSTPWGINYKSQVDVQYAALAMIEAQKPARLSCFGSPHALWYSELSADDCNSDLPHSHNTGKPRVFSFIEVNVLLIIVIYTDLVMDRLLHARSITLSNLVSIALFHIDFPRRWAAITTYISSQVITTYSRLYSNIKQNVGLL